MRVCVRVYVYLAIRYFRSKQRRARAVHDLFAVIGRASQRKHESESNKSIKQSKGSAQGGRRKEGNFWQYELRKHLSQGRS